MNDAAAGERSCAAEMRVIGFAAMAAMAQHFGLAPNAISRSLEAKTICAAGLLAPKTGDCKPHRRRTGVVPNSIAKGFSVGFFDMLDALAPANYVANKRRTL